MNNFTCLSAKHLGLWSLTMDSFAPAYPSIRGTENQLEGQGLE